MKSEIADRKRQRFTSPAPTAPILVGFDGKEGGRDALELARVLGRIRETRCVVAVPQMDGLAEQARTALGDPDARVRGIGVLSPARALIRTAEQEHAGTLVVGCSRADRLEKALIGTTAGQLLKDAPCEVVVAPRDYAAGRHQSFAKIAVGVDGTAASKVALTRAEDLARQAGARIEILVSEDPVVAGFEAAHPYDAPASVSDLLEAAMRSVDPALEPTGKRVDPGWHRVTRTIAATLVDALDADVDLLVTGARRPVEHLFFGSVTRHLVNTAPCPVLVIPHSRQV